ncbi:MAG: Na+/H+ antiporter subunit E [Phenylobacterium sp.]|uniref:Na+/H+ antiporter subunit E n=1 Tax=Phenylobacterium sp. TaxID=1871053 RepID=UPI002730015A|nr:Na+/H+ antiporter subunit E [Phenylobacterium sp.]MDP2009012.1 Na+/H+ antiporter subunit E [Phenylobacterium sp.]
MLNRILPQPALTGIVVVVWLLLLNSLTFGGFLIAMAVGLSVPFVTKRFWPQGRPLRWGPAMVGYFAVVLYDIVIANFEVAYIIVVRRNGDLRSGWLTVPLELRSAEAITTLAATISLTPGTVSTDVSADGRVLLVHALDVADKAAAVTRIKVRYEARLLRIFA